MTATGHPVLGLTIAKHQHLRILVPLKDGERFVAASGGRLELDEQRALVAAGHP